MILTHEGHVFLRHAENLLAAYERTCNAVRKAPDSSTAGSLALGITPLLIGYFLTPILDRYARSYPNVSLNVVENRTEFLLHHLLGGEIDAAIVLLSGMDDARAFHTQPLVESPWHVWVAPSHPLAEAAQLDWADLAKHRLVHLQHEALGHFLNSREVARHIPDSKLIRTTSIEAVRNLVARGVACAILPDFVFRSWSLDGDRLEMRDFSAEIAPVSIGLAWRRGTPVSADTSGLIEIAGEIYRTRAIDEI
jgi:DNA-binding transcriptional LysR family regulator